MLAFFIAAGAMLMDVEVPVGTIDVPAERTAALIALSSGASAGAGLPNGAAVWRQALDPADRTPFAFDWSGMLDDGEQIDTILRLAVSASAAALGVKVDDTAGRLPTLDDQGEQKAYLWLLVDPALQANAAFLGTGIPVGIAMLIRTTSTPPRELERTSVVTVRQQ